MNYLVETSLWFALFVLCCFDGSVPVWLLFRRALGPGHFLTGWARNRGQRIA